MNLLDKDNHKSTYIDKNTDSFHDLGRSTQTAYMSSPDRQHRDIHIV